MVSSSKRLGYGGSAVIDTTQVVVTGGSFDRADAPAMLEMFDLPSILDTGTQKRGRVFHAPGTSTFTGSLSFDVNKKVMDNVVKVDKILDRNWEFNVGIHDGENSYTMSDCLAQTVSLSGSPGGLINCTVSFMAIAEKVVGAVTNDYILNYDDDPDNQPAAYWWSGGTDIRDWTFSYSQDIAPVYTNRTDQEPKYLRAGLVSYSLAVTTYSELLVDTIKIMASTFVLTGKRTARGYTFNGATDLGMYSHTFETAASGSSDAVVIT
jgi:hypothetical protein